jgi:formamidopyrimidine-DNA glycosylase
MPELPEVETIRRGIKPLIVGKVVSCSILRSTRLRWSVSSRELQTLNGQQVLDVARRAKFLILRFSSNWLVLHMGMSGTLRFCRPEAPALKHDHFDLVFRDGTRLRFRDPRKFGGIIFFRENPLFSNFLSGIGPEPFSEEVNGRYLYNKARGKKVPVKSFIMDQRIMAGVGNIYANEALFLSRIRPSRAAGQVAEKRYEMLAQNIRQVLSRAIEAGGTSIRDFQNENGDPGYFALELLVYGKAGCPCPQCGERLSTARIGQRSTFFCQKCQK